MVLHLYICFTRVLTISEIRATVGKIKAEEEEAENAHSKMQIDNPLWCHAVPECHLVL